MNQDCNGDIRLNQTEYVKDTSGVNIHRERRRESPTATVDENHGSKVSPYNSKKIARVVASTLASETYALFGALDQLSWIRLHWNWMIDPSTVWNKPSETPFQDSPRLCSC